MINVKLLLKVPDPQSVTLTSNCIFNGADVTLNCIVELNPTVTVMKSELTLLDQVVDVQLSRNATGSRSDNIVLKSPMLSGTTLTYSMVMNSFLRSDSGNYSCMVTIRSPPSSINIYGTGKPVSNQTQVTTGNT